MTDTAPALSGVEGGVTRWQYDVRGQVLAETRTVDGAAYTTAWGYNTAGRVVTTTYPTGEVVSTD